MITRWTTSWFGKSFMRVFLQYIVTEYVRLQDLLCVGPLQLVASKYWNLGWPHVTRLKKYTLIQDITTTDIFVIELDFHSTKWALWLVDSWSCAPDQKFKCIPTGIQLHSCCLHAVFVFAIWKSIYNKTVNVWSCGKLVYFVFPRVLMFLGKTKLTVSLGTIH